MYIHTYTYIYIYIYIHTYTYTHTYIRRAPDDHSAGQSEWVAFYATRSLWASGLAYMNVYGSFARVPACLRASMRTRARARARAYIHRCLHA